MDNKMTAKEFYETVQKELDIIRLAAFGLDINFIDITVHNRGEICLDIYTTNEDGKTVTEGVGQNGFKSPFYEAEKRVLE